MAVLVQYPCADASPANVDPNASAGSLVNLNSLDPFAFASGFGYASEPILRTSALAGATSAASAVSAGSFFMLSLTPNAEFWANLSDLQFDVARGGSSTPRGWVVRTSVDGFAANVATATIPTVRPDFTHVVVDLSAAQFQHLTSPLVIRIYVFVPTAVSSIIDIDSIVLNGIVELAVVQEPTGLLSFAGRVTPDVVPQQSDYDAFFLTREEADAFYLVRSVPYSGGGTPPAPVSHGAGDITLRVPTTPFDNQQWRRNTSGVQSTVNMPPNWSLVDGNGVLPAHSSAVFVAVQGANQFVRS